MQFGTVLVSFTVYAWSLAEDVAHSIVSANTC